MRLIAMLSRQNWLWTPPERGFMNTRLRLLLIGLGGLLIAAVSSFPLWQPIFVNFEVEEPFEIAIRLAPTEMQADLRAMAAQNPTMGATMAVAAATSVAVPTEQQAMPEMPEAEIISDGSFIRIDALHNAEGTATIYQLPDGTRLLRFEDFRSTNGPELHVILSADPDPRSEEELGENRIDLGPLKGNTGNQNYEILAEADLSLYQSVVIYCVSFQMVFSTASLGTF
jgi:hypothetical protein